MKLVNSSGVCKYEILLTQKRGVDLGEGLKRLDDRFAFPTIFLSILLVRRNYTGCLDLIVGRVMAMWGEQDYR